MQHLLVRQRLGEVHQALVRPGELPQQRQDEQLQQQPGVRAVAVGVVLVAAVSALRRVQGPGERAQGEAAVGAQPQHVLAQPGGPEQHLRQADASTGQDEAAAGGDGGEPLRRPEEIAGQPAGGQRLAERIGAAVRSQDRLQ